MDVRKILTIIITAFVWSVFGGFMTSVTGGVLYPPINKIATPFVCSNGEMQVLEKTYRPAPGETVTTLTWYCVNAATGVTTEIPTLKIGLFAIPMYSMIFFIPILIITAVWQLSIGPASRKKRQSAVINGSLEKYQGMLESNRINQGQYDQIAQSLNDYYEKKSHPSSAAAPKPDAEQQLKKLKELYEASLITKQEYEAKKADILGRM